MRISHTVPASPAPPSASDPIEWLFLEVRGSETAHGGRYGQTTLEFWPGDAGQEATLTDGRMTYAHDPGTTERWYYSTERLLRDGIDPGQAAEDVRRGAAELTAILERHAASGELDGFRIPRFSRPPRLPDQVDLWIRRESGARERWIVPVLGAAGGPLADALVAASAFSAKLRASYEELDPALLPAGAA